MPILESTPLTLCWLVAQFCWAVYAKLPKSAIFAVPSLLKRMFWLLMSPAVNDNTNCASQRMPLPGVDMQTQDNRGRTVEDFGPVLVQMGQAPANLAHRARQTAETFVG